MKRYLLFFLIFLLFLFINNTSLFVKRSSHTSILLAHRGLAQTFHKDGLTSRTNTASRIFKPVHPYLENTLPSIEAAFRCGADIVEFDVHPTKDGQFAVFHDDVLEYRTNDTGFTEQHTLAELQKLDIGYGYTADSGKTFPFREKGIGMMLSLEQVLDAFPGKRLLIHLKSDEPGAGRLLADHLIKLPPGELALLSVYGGDRSIAALKKKLPLARVLSKSTVKSSLGLYTAIGWTGYIPQSLHNSIIIFPENYAPFLWGWPHRFLQRMEKVNTIVILVKGKGDYSEGFDAIEDLGTLPVNYTGGIWTNRIDIVGAYYNSISR